MKNALDSLQVSHIFYSMEEKLEEFKRRRRKEILLNKQKLFFRGIMKNIPGFRSPPVSEASNSLLGNSAQNYEVGSESEISSVVSDDNSIDLSVSVSCPSWLTLATYACYFCLWVIMYMVAIHYEFGYVYLVISGLVFIYLNTRTGPKKKGEISAYSVFNPNCEAIDGTLKSEHFEREFNLIRHEVSPPLK